MMKSCAVFLALLAAARPAWADADDELFEKRIRPILVKECFACHAGKNSKNNLRVDSRQALLKGGDAGPAVVPGKPQESLLLQAIRAEGDGPQMPPKKRLSKEVAKDFERWIQAGASWPADVVLAGDVHAGKNHWAFQPLRSNALSIDHHIDAALEKKGLQPVGPADMRTLLRRATYDLIGLPPTPEETREFLEDQSPEAFRKVIDRLLDSPHYGERWGRHWLDVVRYADTAGNAPDFPVPQAWRYRNYVIRAFNQDKPYDEFLREQIAGDLISPAHLAESRSLRRALAAEPSSIRESALRALTAIDPAAAPAVPALERTLGHEDPIARQAAATALVHIDPKIDQRLPAVGVILERKARADGRYATLLRRIRVPQDVAAHSFFHDHGLRYGPTAAIPEYKGHQDLPPAHWVYVFPYWYLWQDRGEAADPQGRHDPVIATGYLAIHRRFSSTEGMPDHLEIEDIVETLGRSVLALGLSCARCHDHKFDPITNVDYYALYGIFGSTRFPFTGAEGNAKQKHFVSLGADGDAYAVSEGTPGNAKIQIGGDPGKTAAEAPRGAPGIVGGQHLPAGAPGSGRLQLAGWLTDPATNPLAARVMVNRIWQHHFGQGLVKTPNDFGVRGTPPTHPELLDALAVRFVESGFSIKSMHRLILLSRAWQRSSSGRADQENDLLWRFPRRRLDAESIRDSLLALSGDLDRTPAEAHPFPPKDKWSFSQHAPFDAVYESRHRSVYLMQQRIKRHPYLSLFDGPDPNASTGARLPTTTPVQALFWMNDPFFHVQAEKIARRWTTVDAAFEHILGRPPTGAERTRCEDYLKKDPDGWAGLVRVLLASNEFLYVD
jgi:hypothetical protein